jgi:D-alanine-D-alanine ligase
LISREVITHVKKGVIADQFYAERLYTYESIRYLLQQAGLADIQLHTEILTGSQRGQDLGMMERRIIVTGRAKKEWAPVKKTVKAANNVAVLLGDPRKEDLIKLNCNFDEDDFYTVNELKKALVELKEYHFVYLDRHEDFINDLRKMRGKIDFVLNLCDEGYGNDATKELHIPSLLEILGIPYTGGTPQCLAYCYDKSLVRGVGKEMDIPVPEAFIIKPEDTTFIGLQIEFPVIVKPNFGDSSYGITQESVCYNVKELENALIRVREIKGYDKPILIEQFLTGADLSVGIIGNPPERYQVLPIIAEDYSTLPPELPRICGYEAKWDPTSPYWQIKSIPADLSEEVKRYLVASCIQLFIRLECNDYARFDWRVDTNDTPRLLEVNPNPGWCWDGHMAKMANLAGISYAQMLKKILKACEKRLKRSIQ